MNKRICPNCGKELRENINFCVHCGLKLEINNEQENVINESSINEKSSEEIPISTNFSVDEKEKKSKRNILIVIGVILSIVSITMVIGFTTNKIKSPNDDEVLEYFRDIDFSFDNVFNQNKIKKENNQFLYITTKNIEDDNLANLVSLFIKGCEIQNNAHVKGDIVGNQEWSKGQEYKSEALIKLYNFHYLNGTNDEFLENCYRIYFWMNIAHNNGTDIHLYYDNDNNICYDLKIENNTGENFEEITFVSSINGEENVDTIYNFNDGEIETLTFKIENYIEDGASITSNFNLLDYKIEDSYF